MDILYKPVNIVRSLTVMATLVMFVTSALADEKIKDLRAEIDAGHISLGDVTANGSSSGASLEGYLVNETENVMNVGVSLHSPLLLINRGKGQNMFVLRVYGADGRYRIKHNRSFISLPPKQRAPIHFVAYCADFQKDNPSNTDTFTLGIMPSYLQGVVRNINQYADKNPRTDITRAAQIAIWLAQDVSITDIRKKLPFSSADEQLAQTFLRNSLP